MNKTYIIAANYKGMTGKAEALAKNAKLDADIQRLAKSSGETISLRQFKKPAAPAGAVPLFVLVQCSEAFLEKVKSLQLFHSASVLDPAIETIDRSSAPQIEALPPVNNKKKGPKGP